MKNTENNFEKEIFKNASKTYFNSSLFFPKEKKQSVFELYSFVRLADDFVDSVPQNTKAFNLLKLKYQKKLADSPDKNINRVLKNIYKLQEQYPITDADVDSFLKSMSMDLTNKNYISMKDTLEYIYGSAEVIGLMMAKILGLETESYTYACYQGRAMQYINFIRDIKEDIKLGRCYFPEIIRKNLKLSPGTRI
jgi:phytoene synthase